MKVGKTLSDLGSRVPGSWQSLWHFSRNFSEEKNRVESDVKWGHQHNMLEQKKMRHLSYFGQDLDSKERVGLGSGTVCYCQVLFFTHR